MQHQFTTDTCEMMMVQHRMRSFMDSAHVASWPSLDSAHVVSWPSLENVLSTMYPNAYGQNLIYDSELVSFLEIHKTAMRHSLVLVMAM